MIHSVSSSAFLVGSNFTRPSVFYKIFMRTYKKERPREREVRHYRHRKRVSEDNFKNATYLKVFLIKPKYKSKARPETLCKGFYFMTTDTC